MVRVRTWLVWIGTWLVQFGPFVDFCLKTYNLNLAGDSKKPSEKKMCGINQSFRKNLSRAWLFRVARVALLSGVPEGFRAWLRFRVIAARSAGVRVRPPLLSSSSGLAHPFSSTHVCAHLLVENISFCISVDKFQFYSSKTLTRSELDQFA